MGTLLALDSRRDDKVSAKWGCGPGFLSRSSALAGYFSPLAAIFLTIAITSFRSLSFKLGE